MSARSFFHTSARPISAPSAGPSRSRRLIRCSLWVALVASGAGLAAGVGDAGASPLTTSGASMTVQSTAAVTGLLPAQRLSVPTTAAAPTTTAPINNLSSCRTNLASPVATVSIPSISYQCPLYSGSQATIDSGAATWISQPASVTTLATHAGGPGAIWLAGHRSSHGGAFAAIPDLQDGAIVTVSDATGSASYRIVGRVYVQVRGGLVLDSTGTPTTAATLSALLRPDLGGSLEPRLVIQTCDGENFRWMIYGDLISG